MLNYFYSLSVKDDTMRGLTLQSGQTFMAMVKLSVSDCRNSLIWSEVELLQPLHPIGLISQTICLAHQGQTRCSEAATLACSADTSVYAATWQVTVRHFLHDNTLNPKPHTKPPHALLGAAAGAMRFLLAHLAPGVGNWLLLPLLLSPAAAACCCSSCAAAAAAGSPPAAAAACAAAAAASAATDALNAALGCHRSSSDATIPKRRPAHNISDAVSHMRVWSSKEICGLPVPVPCI